VLAKGTALAATAAMLAVGTGIVPVQHNRAQRPKSPVAALGIVPGGGDAQSSDASSLRSSAATPGGPAALPGATGVHGGSPFAGGRRHAGGSAPGASREHRRASGEDEHGLLHDAPHRRSADGGSILGGDGETGAPALSGSGHVGATSADVPSADRSRHGGSSSPSSDGLAAKSPEEAPGSEPEPPPALEPRHREAEHSRSGKTPEAVPPEPPK
jgi:hypothetical protein